MGKTLERVYQKVLEFYIQKKLKVGAGFDAANQLPLEEQLELIHEESAELSFEGRHFHSSDAGLEDLTRVVKEICDILYTCMGFFVVLGIDPSDVFDMVHESNMNKEGYIDKRGKFVKGDSYVPPHKDIHTYLERRIGNGQTG